MVRSNYWSSTLAFIHYSNTFTTALMQYSIVIYICIIFEELPLSFRTPSRWIHFCCWKHVISDVIPSHNTILHFSLKKYSINKITFFDIQARDSKQFRSTLINSGKITVRLLQECTWWIFRVQNTENEAFFLRMRPSSTEWIILYWMISSCISNPFF